MGYKQTWPMDDLHADTIHPSSGTVAVRGFLTDRCREVVAELTADQALTLARSLIRMAGRLDATAAVRGGITYPIADDQ